MPIEVNNITYTYMRGTPMEHVAIKDISLTVNEGEFLGLIGHTGSGKSTFVQHLNGLLQPFSGSVTVDGIDMSDKKRRSEGRSHVGMVFQYPEYQLFEETVAKDVAFGPINMGLSQAETDERVNDALRLVGLAPEVFRDKSPFDLSGGEKRRAALAGIVAMRPRYLVLDEPMAGLDPAGRRDILDMIERLRQSLGCAVVMVSHSMDDVARYADRIAVLSDGRIVMCDTPEAVFSRAEELVSMGLDVPQVTRLALRLRELGMDVPHGIFDADGLTDYIIGRTANAQ